ncbi:MAG TPA: cytochrome c maturation protein CcmE [Bryobacteraceae bacterium]
MNTYVKFGILMVLIVGSLAWLAVGGIKDTQTYYKTISELQKMGPKAHTQRIRVGGNVVPGSIIKDGTRVSFVLEQGVYRLNVVYTGNSALPDTFRDGSQALADGRLGPKGVFQASQVEAKCASKYAPKPVHPHNLSQPGSTTAKAGNALSSAAGHA